MRRRLAGEGGAVAVFTALLLVVLMLSTAFVIDLGFMRYDRVATKAVADQAAAGASAGFSPSEPNGDRDACLEALAIADANLPQLNLAASAVAGRSCAETFLAGVACDPAVVRTAAYSVDGYLVEVTIPVPDDPAHPKGGLLEGLDHGEWDGVPCERVGVEVSHESFAFFSGFTGSAAREITLSSVGRSRLDGRAREFATLVVLKRDGCNTLDVSGTTRVTISDSDYVDDEGNPKTARGNVTVDTAQSGCTGSGYVLNTQGNNSFITASGDIVSFNLTAPPTNRTFDASKTGNAATFQLSPIPRPGARITRAPVDHLLNCMTTYPTDRVWSPRSSMHSTPAQPILPCGEGPTAPVGPPPPPYIQNLHGALQSVTAAQILAQRGVSGQPFADWAVYPNDFPGRTCGSATGTYGPANDRPTGVSGRHWFINCPRPAPDNGPFTPQGFTFNNVQNVVSRNWINLSSTTGNFRIVGDANQGAILYLQGADNNRDSNNNNQNRGIELSSSGQIRLEGVVVYSDWGYIDIIGNSSSQIVWRTPAASTEASCTGYTSGLPPAGCLRPLALWSNSRIEHRLGGQASIDISGVYFTPNANAFNLSGQTNQTLNEAQFFSYAIELSGGARIDMQPNPDTNIGIPLRGSSLIR
jgi:hypothetical protein